MQEKQETKSNIAPKVLFFLGVFDLIRGFLHTFAVNWAASTFAHLDLSSQRQNQLWLLGAFGISNWLTGAMYILISQKAKSIAPYVLLIIPAAYILGIISLRFSGVVPEAPFLGKYIMIGYLGICIISALFSLKRK